MSDDKPAEVPVTVLMPVYNAAAYLPESMESILGQTFRDFEFLIIDDGSVDESAQIARSYGDARVRLVSTPNRGVAETLRLGVELAAGAYIARMDADDTALPERLSRQVEVLERFPEVAVVHSKVDYVDGQGRVIHAGMGDPTSDLQTRWNLVWHNVPFHSTTMIRASVLRRNGLNYRTDMDLAEDFDLWNRIALLGRFHFIPEVLLRYRIHGGAVTKGEKSRYQLAVQGRVVRENFRRYGIDLPEGLETELVVLAGSTRDDPARRRYPGLERVLPEIEQRLAGSFERTHGLEHSDISAIRAAQLVKWARVTLSTSRVLVMRLLIRAWRLYPGILWGRRPWVIVAAAMMPRVLREALETRARTT